MTAYNCKVDPLNTSVYDRVLFFLISFIMYATIRTESIRWLIPGQEQEHVE